MQVEEFGGKSSSIQKNMLNGIIYDRLKFKSLIKLSVYVCLMLIAAIVFSRYADKEILRLAVENSGNFGMAVYFLIEVFYVTFTPLLNTIVLVASGYIFGGNTGFVINFFANIVGLFLIVVLVQRYGRPLLQRVVSPNIYQEFDSLTQKIGPITLLVVYVLPFTPDDELTYIIAAGPIGIKRFILPILIGTLAKAAYSYIGDLGSKGVAVAAYARIAALIIGVILVGSQEYFMKRRIAAKTN